MQKYIQMLLDQGADAAVKIEPVSIVTGAWVAYKCRFGCARYNSNLCCPPHTPTYKETDEMLACYNRAILFRCHKMRMVSEIAVKVTAALFLDDYYKAICFGSGPCRKCEKCGDEGCNFPREAVPSMEACGIDVFATARANGFDIHTLKNKNDIQSYFGLILID